MGARYSVAIRTVCEANPSCTVGTGSFKWANPLERAVDPHPLLAPGFNVGGNIPLPPLLDLMIYDIFINCSWIVTRWQYTFTQKQYIEQHK
jgi:hypothetical protein